MIMTAEQIKNYLQMKLRAVKNNKEVYREYKAYKNLIRAEAQEEILKDILKSIR